MPLKQEYGEIMTQYPIVLTMKGLTVPFIGFADFVFIKEDAYIYFNSINTRLLKLLDIFNLVNKNVNLDNAVDTIKPPIFWKDKEIIKQQISS